MVNNTVHFFKKLYLNYLIKKAGIMPALRDIKMFKSYFALESSFFAAALFTFSVARSAAPNGLFFAKSTNIGAATKIDE